jgi:hypothetical protein
MNKTHVKPINKVVCLILQDIEKHRGLVFGGLIGLISTLFVV